MPPEHRVPAPKRTTTPTSADWENAGRFATIEECMDWAMSYAASVREAAYRQERVATGLHLQQLRETLVVAIAAFKAME